MEAVEGEGCVFEIVYEFAASYGSLGAAIVLSSIAAILTSVGASLVFILGGNEKEIDLIIDVGLGFSSGIMITASFTSLLIPAIERSGVTLPLLGFLFGALTIHLINKKIPHEHLVKGYEGPKELRSKLKVAWLVALAIIIHNLPEGMAIGATTLFNTLLGFKTAIAIGLQDIPEGLAVALPIAMTQNSKTKGFFLGVLSGISEVVAAAITAAITFIDIGLLLPFTMGAGAGAMIYVVSHEAIPESHRGGHENKATLGLFLGFSIMLVLDTMLG